MDEALRNYSLEEMDRQSLLHPLTSIADHMKTGPRIVSSASGVMLKDKNGRSLIDCAGGEAGSKTDRFSVGRPPTASKKGKPISTTPAKLRPSSVCHETRGELSMMSPLTGKPIRQIIRGCLRREGGIDKAQEGVSGPWMENLPS